MHRLTLDRDAQSALEALAAEQTKLWAPASRPRSSRSTTRPGRSWPTSARPATSTTTASAPSTWCRRCARPALKPVIYGLAFEQGLAHPETLIEDRPARFGATPRNFDEDFHGTVTIREALGQSLNVPAVKVLNAVGPARLVGRLRRFGLAPVLPAASEPTLAVALGGLGLRMVDLAALYAGLARGGEPVALTWRREPPAVRQPGTAQRPPKAPRRLLSPVAAWYVTDILKDAPPPPATAGGRIAYKTGTSTATATPGRSATTAATRSRSGWPARWRLDARPAGPHRGRADPVRCVRAVGRAPRSLAAAPVGRAEGDGRLAAAAAQALRRQ